MSPLFVLHVTPMRCRNSIRRLGLLCSQPQKGRPFGVYVFSDGIRHRVLTHMSRTPKVPRVIRWTERPDMDTWQVAYIGPVTADAYVENALVLLERVEPEYVTLVTRNDS